MRYETHIVERMRSEGYEVPMQFEVCPTCEGYGSHSRNLGALTADDVQELGYEFMEDYAAGHYDSRCETCEGKRVIEVLDESKATQETISEYRESLDSLEQMHREQLAEQKVGA